MVLAKVVLHFTSLVWLAVTLLIVTRWAAELHSGFESETRPTTSFDVGSSGRLSVIWRRYYYASSRKG